MEENLKPRYSFEAAKMLLFDYATELFYHSEGISDKELSNRIYSVIDELDKMFVNRKYYIISRKNNPITKKYIEENLKDAKSFSNYEEAKKCWNNYKTNDRYIGIFYKTEDGYWLQAHGLGKYEVELN